MEANLKEPFLTLTLEKTVFSVAVDSLDGLVSNRWVR